MGQSTSKAPTCLEVDGEVVSNPHKMAEVMASHYGDKVADLRTRRTAHPSKDPVQRLRDALSRRLPGRGGREVMELQPVSRIKMWELLRRYKGGKALGGDSLDGHLIKTASKVLLPALTHIVNLSIKEGTFLERWKFHVVLPHHKSGGREDPDNFRPVCHLVELGKLVELVVWEQLMSHTLQGQLLHPNHHGSLPGHSPITAICQVQDALTRAADAKQLAALVLLDQKAAFDLVDHSTLKAKMVECGFGDSMLDWMGSYLHQRRYVVQMTPPR